jgi:teichuronic acid exporter
MSFKKGLFKNILVAGGYSYFSQALVFLSSVVLSRILTPDNYGLVNLITVFTGFIMVFSDGGLSYALIRSDYGRTYHRVLTNLSFILGIVLFLLTLLIAYPISIFYNNSKLVLPTIVLGFTFIIKSLSLTQGAVLAKRLDFAYIGKVTLFSTIVIVVLNIILAYLGATYWALIIPQIIAAIIVAICYERKVKLGFKIFSLAYIIVAFRYTKRLIGSVIGFNTINYWSRNADNMIVGKCYGSTDLGLYNRAYNLLTLPLTLITGLFSNILFPSLKILKQSGGNIEKEYYFVLRVIMLIAFPIVIVLVLFPNQLVHLLWGMKWIKVASFLPYFGILIFTQTLLSTVGQLLILENKERQFMVSGWISAVFIIGGILLGARISLVAIAQFYSLFYIVFVLTYNIIHIYIITLKFDIQKSVWFWFTKIAFSLLLWLSVYFNMDTFKYITLLCMFLYVMFETRNELGSFFLNLKRKKVVVS